MVSLGKQEGKENQVMGVVILDQRLNLAYNYHFSMTISNWLGYTGSGWPRSKGSSFPIITKGEPLREVKTYL